MKTIIKQSADGIALIRDNKLDTTQGKVFINNHEITDIDTFFKVAKENTRLLKQCKKQKEVIDRIKEYIQNHQLVFKDSTLEEIEEWFNQFYIDVLDILKEVSE